MTPSLRIASLDYPGSGAERLDAAHPWHRFAEIQQVLRRQLPAGTASVFARPETKGPSAVDWYSDLAGQPVPLSDLPDAEQEEARRLLKDHLRAVSRLAEELRRQDPANADTADLLNRAIRYPGDSSVYVIAGAPVLTSWGSTVAGRTRDEGSAAGAVGAGGSTARWPRWLLPVLGLALIAGLLAGGWFWYQQRTEQGLREALQVALEHQCQETLPLVELAARLERIDPEAERYPDIHMAVLTEAGICDDAAAIAHRLTQAEHCDLLPALDEELSLYDIEREPFGSLRSQLDARLAACRQVQALWDRLAAAAGDCAAVASLNQEAHRLDGQSYPVEDLFHALDSALAACRLAAELAPRVNASAGQCMPLRDLAREAARDFADHDVSRAPLRGVKDALDAEIARCDLADHLERELATSQGDCLVLAGMRETLSRHDNDREPLAALARRLDVALEHCAVLTDLEQRFADAQGDCAGIKALTETLEQYRNNLRFLDIRTRLQRELEVCGQASDLEGQIAEADCAKARELASNPASRGDPRFASAYAALDGRLADCDRVERYERLLAEAGKDCSKLETLGRDLKREKAESLRPVRQRLDKALGPCRPKPKPPAPPIIASRGAAPNAPAPKTPKGSGSFPMRGQCTGSLVITSNAGWNGQPVRHIVTIDPPASARVARVTSSNPGCRNCRLSKVGANVWRGNLYYRCGGRGIVQVSYAA
jgi:hypothetical protein